MKKRIVRVKPGEPRPKDRTDWPRLDAITDEENEAALRNDPDTAPYADGTWLETAKRVQRPNRNRGRGRD